MGQYASIKSINPSISTVPCVSSVSNTADPIVLQIIFYFVHSTAKFLVKFIIPPLADEYALIHPPGKITLEYMDPTFIILPFFV